MLWWLDASDEEGLGSCDWHFGRQELGAETFSKSHHIVNQTRHTSSPARKSLAESCSGGQYSDHQSAQLASLVFSDISQIEVVIHPHYHTTCETHCPVQKNTSITASETIHRLLYRP